ncbi:ROK family protein [Sphingomonas sp. HF-S3]|uniref:fructokinase n=1 Tax=Sphingomonas rustica TaxID=3103142 RepID=A0ABV0BDW5_9SPHN
MAHPPLIAGLELGGTKCVALLASGPGDVRDRLTVPTTTPAETLAALEAALDRWSFDAIGVASFGPLELDPDHAAYGALTATTKPGWTGVDVSRRFADRYGKPLAIQTDVNGAALAEARWGAARGMSTHIYITIGTGVGVGTIVGGRPVQGVAHAEAGHMRIPRRRGDGFAGACTFHRDCVEGLISGPALAARFGITGEALPQDGPEWDLFVHDLVGLLHNLVTGFAPQRISIGGGVIASRQHLFPRIRKALDESIAGYGAFGGLGIAVGPPGLGDMAGPMGAIAMGLSALDR